LEYWSIGKAGEIFVVTVFSSLQYSITPVLQYFNIPDLLFENMEHLFYWPYIELMFYLSRGKCITIEGSP
jgi:hypothetical protein